MPTFLELCKTAIDDNDLPRLEQLFQALQQANKALYRLRDSVTKGRIYLYHSQDILHALLEHAARKNNFAMVKVLSASGASKDVIAKALANIVVQERPEQPDEHQNNDNNKVKATIDKLPNVDSVSWYDGRVPVNTMRVWIAPENVYQIIPRLVDSILDAKNSLEEIGVTDFDELSIFKENPGMYDNEVHEVHREKLMMILRSYTNNTERFKQILQLPGLDRHHFESAFDVLAEKVMKGRFKYQLNKTDKDLLDWVHSQHQRLSLTILRLRGYAEQDEHNMQLLDQVHSREPLSPIVARLWRGGAWLEYILEKYHPEELFKTQWTFRLRNQHNARLRYDRNTKERVFHREYNGTALQVVAAAGTYDDIETVIARLKSVDQRQVDKAIVGAYAYAKSEVNLECLLKAYKPAEQNKLAVLSNALYTAIQIQNTDGAMALLKQGARIIPSTPQQATKWKNGLIKKSFLTLNTKLSDEFFTQLFKMHCNCDNQEIIAIIAELAYMHDNTELLKKLFDHSHFFLENLFTSSMPRSYWCYNNNCLGMLLFKYGLDTFQKKPGFNVLYEQGIKLSFQSDNVTFSPK